MNMQCISRRMSVLHLYTRRKQKLYSEQDPEDNVVKGKYFEVHDTSLLMWLSLTENQRLLSALINAAGVF